MDYTTQMDAARKGIITREMELVARKEKRTAEEIRQWVAEGRAAIPCNRVHKALDPERHRLHAEDEDQCEPWDLQRLHGSWTRRWRR